MEILGVKNLLKRWDIDHEGLYNTINRIDIPVYIETPEYYQPEVPETRFTRIDPILITIRELKDENCQYIFRLNDIVALETDNRDKDLNEIFIKGSFIKFDRNDVFSIIRNTCLEIYELYKNLPDKTGKEPEPEKRWREATLSYFDSHPNKFEYIKRGFLEDSKVYKLDYSRPSRVFAGRLLRKTLRYQGLLESIKKTSIRDLSQIYYKIIKG
jgi:hypothetical protein